MNTPNKKDVDYLARQLNEKQAQFEKTLKSDSLDDLWDTGVSLVINIDKLVSQINELVRHYHTEMLEIIRTPAEVDINALLDKIGARMEVVLSRAGEESMDEKDFFAKFGVEQFEIDEMLVDTKPTPLLLGRIDTKEHNDHLVMQKLQLLMSLLYSHDCLAKDFYIVHGKNRPGTIRYRPYALVVIPKWNRMVLINAGYGAATFVIPGVYGWREISTRDGDELQEELGAHRIVYYGESKAHGDEEWKQEVAKYLFGNNTAQEIQDMQGLQKQELYRYHILQEISTAEAWMGMSIEEKSNFNPYGGKKLFAIAGIFGIKGNPAKNSHIMAQLGRKIYGMGHECIECELWSKEEWQEKLIEKVATAEVWMRMNRTNRLNFKPYGDKGLTAIAGIFGIKGNPIGYSQIIAELGRKIYGTGHECIECEFWSKEEWQGKLIEKVATPEAWIKMNLEEKRNFKPYGGKGFIAIAGIFGIKGDPANNSQVMAELGKKIYGTHEIFDVYEK